MPSYIVKYRTKSAPVTMTVEAEDSNLAISAALEKIGAEEGEEVEVFTVTQEEAEPDAAPKKAEAPAAPKPTKK